MTVVDRVTSLAERSSITKMSLAGAIYYALWGGLHLQAAYAVYHVAGGLQRNGVTQDVGIDRLNHRKSGWSSDIFHIC
jgi:hypothetical protein